MKVLYRGHDSRGSYYLARVGEDIERYPLWEIRVVEGFDNSGCPYLMEVETWVLHPSGADERVGVAPWLMPFVLTEMALYKGNPRLPTMTVFGEASVIDPNWSVNIEFDVGRPFSCDEFGDYQEFTGPVVSVAGPDVTGPIRVTIRTARGFIRGQAPEVGLFQNTRVHWQATLRVYRQGATLVHSTSPLPV